MKKNRFKKALVSGLVLVLALAAGLPAAAREESQAAQAPVDMKKLLA